MGVDGALGVRRAPRRVDDDHRVGRGDLVLARTQEVVTDRVAALGQLLYGHGVNIIDADQHTDGSLGLFFQRIRMDLRELHTDRHAFERAVAEVADRFKMTFRIAYGDTPARVA